MDKELLAINLTTEELDAEIEEIKTILKKYNNSIKKFKKSCIQCIHPEYDGLCECKNWNELSPYADLYNEIYYGWLYPYLKVRNKEKSKPSRKVIDWHLTLKNLVFNNFSDKDWKEEIEHLEAILEKFSLEMQKRNFCYQCCHPGNKGCCECGKAKEVPDGVYEMFSFFLSRIHWICVYLKIKGK